MFRTRMVGLFACASIALAGSLALSTPASAAGDWVTTFRDDFSGTGLPNAGDWILDTGTQYPGGPAQFGTGEVETLTTDPANVNVRNGSLYITPQRDSSGAWTSARIETTRADFKPAAGEVMEASGRIQMPNVTGDAAVGYWPAFWMLGSPYRADRWSWPGIGEFDIMENVQGINENWATLHCGTWGGPCNEPEGISNGGVTCPGATCQSAFHVYSFQWDRSGPADEMRWYTDGQLTHKVVQSQVPADTWSQMTTHAGYFMILNVSIGGAFPAKLGGGPTATTRPGVPMVVDYVQVQYKAGSGGGPTPTTTPTTPTSSTASPTGSTPPSSSSSSTTAPAAAAPSGLAVTASTASSITIGWKGTAGASYDVLRSGVRIATVNSLTFTDSGLNKNTPYLYSVRGSGVTTPEIRAMITDTATTTTPTTTTSTANSVPTTSTSIVPPTTSSVSTSTGPASGPSGLHVISKTSSSITVGWTGTAEASYDVLRSGVRIATVTGLTFTDIGLLPNTPYIYSIRGNGVTTPEITVTIP